MHVRTGLFLLLQSCFSQIWTDVLVQQPITNNNFGIISLANTKLLICSIVLQIKESLQVQRFMSLPPLLLLLKQVFNICYRPKEATVTYNSIRKRKYLQINCFEGKIEITNSRNASVLV